MVFKVGSITITTALLVLALLAAGQDSATTGPPDGGDGVDLSHAAEEEEAATERTVRQLLLSVEAKMQSMNERLSSLESKLDAHLSSVTTSTPTTADQTNATTVDAGFAGLETKLDEMERRVTVSLEEASLRAGRAEDSYGQLLGLCSLKLDHVEEIGLSVRDLIRDDMVAFISSNFQELREELSRGATQQADDPEEHHHQQQQQMVDGSGEPSGGNDTSEETKVDRHRSDHSGPPSAHHPATAPPFRPYQQQQQQQQHIRPSDWLNASERIAEALRSGERRIQELDGDVKIYTRKVLNTYQDLLKESKDRDAYLHEVMESNNHTRAAVREGFRRLYQQMKPISNLEELLQAIQKKAVEIGTTVDNSFASLLVAQNTFIASCHRIQEQEPHIENRIQQLLEQRLLREPDCRPLNHSAVQPNETFWNTFETHRKDVGRALHDLVWTVITVGNQTAEDVRHTVHNWARRHGCPSGEGETTRTTAAATTETAARPTSDRVPSGDDVKNDRLS